MGKRRWSGAVVLAAIVTAIALASVAVMLFGLAACARPNPAPTPNPQPPRAERLAKAVAVVIAMELGNEATLPGPLLEQLAAIARGEVRDLEPVARTEANQVMSPISKAPCVLVTTDGLTLAGVLLVQTLIGE